jgi:ferric-dicitrate binding protein FerR (iron transport regulator)
MEDKEYSKLNVSELATDPWFLQWRMAGDEESDRFWKGFLEAHPGKKQDIESAIRVIDSIKMNDHHFSPDELRTEWARIAHSLRKTGFRKRKLVLAWSVASSVAILLLIAGLFVLDRTEPDLIVTNNLPESKEIRLALPDQRLVTFGENADLTVDPAGNITASGENERALVSGEAVTSPSQWNKLTVPWGKIASLTLSDGSKVWINAGTVLEFPSVFDDSRREIRVDGEIYIEVTPDGSKPFAVSTPNFAVHVTGTRFNVSAYRNDAVQRVVLVQGSVGVQMPSGEQLQLTPNEMFSLAGTEYRAEKVQAYDYISWKDGVFSFTGERLENILIRLSRHYDVQIACTSEAKNIQVTGKLALFDDLNTVLGNIAVIIPISYTEEDNKIIISKK